MEMARRVEPEWLDELSPADPRAMRSRRDLERVNRLMANAGIVAGELRARLGPAPMRIAEIGAGDGAFALRVARMLPGCKAVDATLVDRHDVLRASTVAAFSARGWQARAVRADVFDWLRGQSLPFDAIFANLFLHHFERDRLRELLALAAARTRLFVACEPRRSAVAILGSRLLGIVGCNDVTRHDAVVSVRAGFRGCEIGELWADAAAWRLVERRRGLFSHSFVAVR